MTKTQSSSLPYPIQATTPMKSVAQQRQSSFITKKSEEILPQEQKKPSEELKRQRQLLKPTQQQRQHKPVEISGSSKTTATPMPGSSSASTHQIKLTQSSSLPYPLQATTPMKPVPQEKQRCLTTRISSGNLGHQQSKAVEVPGRSTAGAATSKPASGIGKYPMERKPRGQAIIINNYKFVEMENRDGTQFDKESLQALLKKLHFGVHTYNDLGASDMENVVKTFSLEDHSDFDCFVFCVLSHGSQGKVYGVDDKSVEIRDLTKHFSAENCKTLASKPKLFFIQACQEQMSMGGVTRTDAVFGNTLIPNEADFVIGYSTVPGYVSYRDTGKGSYYIKALVDQLQELANKHDLVSILANVREEVSKAVVSMEDGGFCTQVPTVVSTLGNKCI
ncbi:caspase-7-like [Ptychodera flava]|uniref:caspase-7-like n=1 Tax=Ptychodera flava TaxID=63121 RepID=UPI003969C384